MTDSLMLDIETLDTKPTAAIAQIAYLVFDSETFDIKQATSSPITLDAQTEKLKRTISSNTLGWWLSQNTSAVNEVMRHPSREFLSTALKDLSETITGFTIETFWSQGTFDFPILESAYRSCGLEEPWKFRQLKDLRTATSFAESLGVDVYTIKQRSKIGRTGHNAVDDCYAQLDVLKEITQCLKTKIAS